MMRAIAFILFTLAAACGGKSAPTPAPTSPMAEHGEGAGDHDMANMPPELAKFHDVLAPRWHADKGPARMKSTCDALPDFHTHADAVAKAAPPAGASADSWTAGGKQLVDAVSALEATCQSNDATAFEIAFQKVHESFHGLLESSEELPGRHHEEHAM